MDGSIRLYRQILDSQVFAHQTALKIWVWCLCKASYKERFVSLKIGKGETTVKISPGQFIFGRFAAEEELGIDGSTIYKWMKKFESSEYDMITIESSNQYSIVSINNWGSYQIDDKPKRTTKEQPSSSQVAAEEQLCSTNNKVNKVYNDFYDAELLKCDNDKTYLAFVKFLFGDNDNGRILTKLLTMNDQIGFEKFQHLRKISEESGRKIKDVCLDLDNYTKKSYSSLNRTLIKWMSNVR